MELPDNILQNSIFIFDRLYLSSWLLTILQNNGIQYVIRCRRNFSPKIDKFFDNNKKHGDVLLRQSRVAWHNKTYDRFNKMGITPDQHRPLFLHLTKSQLPDGSMEVICSWTKNVKISSAQAYTLYGRRWDIEIAIGFEKNEWQIEIFSGYSKNAILQDIYCKIISFNLCSMAASVANKKLHRRLSQDTHKNRATKSSAHTVHQYRVDVNMALFNFKRLLVQIIRHKKSLHTLLLKYIEEVCLYYEPYRPKSSNPRVFVIHKARGKYATFTNYARGI